MLFSGFYAGIVLSEAKYALYKSADLNAISETRNISE